MSKLSIFISMMIIFIWLPSFVYSDDVLPC